MAIVLCVNFGRNHHTIKFCLNWVVLPGTLQPWGGFTDAILEGSHMRLAVQSFKSYCVLAFNYVLHIRRYNLIYTCINVLSLNYLRLQRHLVFEFQPQPGVAMVQWAPKPKNRQEPRTPSCLWIQVYHLTFGRHLVYEFRFYARRVQVPFVVDRNQWGI